MKKSPLDRQKYNEALLKRLAVLITTNPSQRFGQILVNYGFVRHERPVLQETADSFGVSWKDEYYLESEELLSRVENTIMDGLEND